MLADNAEHNIIRAHNFIDTYSFLPYAVEFALAVAKATNICSIMSDISPCVSKCTIPARAFQHNHR